jgi:hypothetical protein
MEVSGQLHDPAPSPSQKKAPVPTKKGAVCSWKTEKTLAPAGNLTIISQLSTCSCLVTALVALSSLHLYRLLDI